MFDVIYDKPEGVARGIYHVQTRARRARVYPISHQSWAGLCLINPRSILHEGFIRHIHPLMFDVIDDKP